MKCVVCHKTAIYICYGQSLCEDCFIPRFERRFRLTAKETEVLRYIAQGYLNKQIAEKLSITEQTVKNHVTLILRKLGATGRTDAAVAAVTQGLIYVGQTAE